MTKKYLITNSLYKQWAKSFFTRQFEVAAERKELLTFVLTTTA
jgi:hypothetical protein